MNLSSAKEKQEQKSACAWVMQLPLVGDSSCSKRTKTIIQPLQNKKQMINQIVQ